MWPERRGGALRLSQTQRKLDWDARMRERRRIQKEANARSQGELAWGLLGQAEGEGGRWRVSRSEGEEAEVMTREGRVLVKASMESTGKGRYARSYSEGDAKMSESVEGG